MNPLYSALKRLPFSGFQSSLIADRRGSAIWPAIETLQKANRSCGRGAATPRRNEPVIFCLEAPERSEGERGGGRTPPCQKP